MVKSVIGRCNGWSKLTKLTKNGARNHELKIVVLYTWVGNKGVKSNKYVYDLCNNNILLLNGGLSGDTVPCSTSETVSICIIQNRYYGDTNHLTFWHWNYFFKILAHSVYEMWLIQEPNLLELWNKLHFEETKTESIYHV